MSIYLIGYMGSGKSTLGKKLAKKLDLLFIDMDQSIETKIDSSISAFFKLHGEEVFRQIEREVLLELIEKNTTCIISTGGGTPCFNDNIKQMNETGLTMYLKRSYKELAHRIHNSKKSRPLVDHFSLPELEEYIEKHLRERASFYEQSRITIPRENQNIEDLTQIILNQNGINGSEEEKTINSQKDEAKKNQ